MDTRDNLYAGGSDDFRGYVWKIPPLQELKEQRENYSPEGWLSSNSDKIGKDSFFGINLVLTLSTSIHDRQTRCESSTCRNINSSLSVNRFAIEKPCCPNSFKLLIRS